MAFQAKKIVFIINDTPYSSFKQREKLDLIMMLASYDHEVSLIFADQGVWQLQEHQAENIKAPAFSSIIKSLVHYKLKGIYACSSSLAQFSLTGTDLLLPIKEIDHLQIQALLQQAELIF